MNKTKIEVTTLEDYLSALPEKVRDKLRKILQGRKGVKATLRQDRM